MNRIKQWRERRGFSQAELARRIGTSQPNLQRYEIGVQKLTVEMMALIADALGVTPLDLLPIAVAADLRNDIEPRAIQADASILALLAAKSLVPHVMLTDAVELLGFPAGAAVVVDKTIRDVSQLRTGDVAVITAASIENPLRTYRIARMFVAPLTLVTNRSERAVALTLSSPDLILSIDGMVVPN